MPYWWHERTSEDTNQIDLFSFIICASEVFDFIICPYGESTVVCFVFIVQFSFYHISSTSVSQPFCIIQFRFNSKVLCCCEIWTPKQRQQVKLKVQRYRHSVIKQFILKSAFWNNVATSFFIHCFDLCPYFSCQIMTSWDVFGCVCGLLFFSWVNSRFSFLECFWIKYDIYYFVFAAVDIFIGLLLFDLLSIF